MYKTSLPVAALKKRLTATATTLSFLSLAVLPAGSGCSFLFVDGPPTAHERLPYFDCTTGYSWPVVDGALAGLQGFRTLYAVSKSDREYAGSPQSREDDIAFGLGFLTLFVMSALSGMNRVNSCNEARAAMMLRAPATPLAPHPQPYPPPAATPPPPAAAPPPSEPVPQQWDTETPAGSPPLPPQTLMRLRFDKAIVSSVPRAFPRSEMIATAPARLVSFQPTWRPVR